MDQENVKRLRLDRRLIGRRGWISAEELEREITELPDVSDKGAVVEPDEAAGDDGSGPAA